MVDSLFDDVNNNTITVTKSTKKRKTNKKVVKQVEDDIDLSVLLGDSTFKVNKKKATSDDDIETDPEKLLKSKKLTLPERLAIINENVLRVLGRQRNNVLVIKDKETFHNYISDCIKAGRIDIDTETNNSLDPITCRLMGPCFYAPGLKQAYVPINHRDPETKIRLPWQLTEQDVNEELARVINCKKEEALKHWKPEIIGQSFESWYDKNPWEVMNYGPRIIMHNGKFDYEVIKCTCNIEVKPDWDTMVGARLLNENEHASLKEQFIKYIDPSQTKYDIEKLFVNVAYADVDPDIFALYAATDAFMTDKLYERQYQEFNQPGYEKLYNNVFLHTEMPDVTVTAEMELYGVAVDTKLGDRLKTKYNAQLAELDTKIMEQLEKIKPLILDWKLTKEANEKTRVYVPKKTKMTLEKIEAQYTEIDDEGNRYKLGKPRAEQLEDPVNLASPAQLAIIFYDVFKCEAVSKKNERATGVKELEALAEALNFKLKATEKVQEIQEFDEEQLREDAEDGTPEEDKEFNIETTNLKAAAALCNLIVKRRGILKLLTTYIEVIPELTKHWPDGRIRFHLNQLGTDTGRYSSGGKLAFMEGDNRVEVSGINIQNIPSHQKNIRLLFMGGTKYHTPEIINNTYYEVPETDEVETDTGWKAIQDLTTTDLIHNVNVSNIIQQGTKYLIYINTPINTRTVYRIVGSDYSAQEPRMTTFLSKEPKMYDAYNSGKDLYAMIAMSAFNNNYEDNLEFYPEGTVLTIDGKEIIAGKKTHKNPDGKDRRSTGKVLNLAATYGMSGKTAGIRLGYSADTKVDPETGRELTPDEIKGNHPSTSKAAFEGDKLLNNFFGGFPKVKEAIEYSKGFLKTNGYVEDFIGRRRHLPDINLMPYTAELKVKGDLDANFNPILGCTNRVVTDSPDKIWEEILRQYVKYSNEYQKKKNPDFVENNEMGNKTFERFKRIALNPKVEKNKVWDDRYQKKETAAEKVLRATGLQIPEESVILHANTGRIAQAERQCFNARIQGSAASLTKMAMIDIHNDDRLKALDTHLIIPVHDELLVECPAFYADQVEKILPEIMINAAKKGGDDVPQSCDPYNVSRWYADEIAATFVDELKKLEEGDPKKGIAPLSHEDALQKMFKDHSEFPEQSILDVVTGRTDELIF